MVEDHHVKILIVGAGAVGQVYARHLHASGAEITFLVKEKHRAETQQGFKLYWLNQQKGREPFHFKTFEIVVAAGSGVGETMAVQLARESGLLLIGFLRGDRFNVYSGSL